MQSEDEESVDLDASFDRIDRLFAQLPFLRCPNCGETNAEVFNLIYDSTTSVPVKEADAFRKAVIIDDSGVERYEEKFRNGRLWCMTCENEFPLPDDWSWE